MAIAHQSALAGIHRQRTAVIADRSVADADLQFLRDGGHELGTLQVERSEGRVVRKRLPALRPIVPVWKRAHIPHLVWCREGESNPHDVAIARF